jgi:hypothetical protein
MTPDEPVVAWIISHASFAREALPICVVEGGDSFSRTISVAQDREAGRKWRSLRTGRSDRLAPATISRIGRRTSDDRSGEGGSAGKPVDKFVSVDSESLNRGDTELAINQNQAV